MSARKLRWLSLLGFLGILGFPLQQPLLYVLFGFYVFLMFMAVRVDERSEANLGRAAAFSYVVTLFALMACFVLVMGLLARVSRADLVTLLGLSLAALYALHVVSFVGSYAYFDARGA